MLMQLQRYLSLCCHSGIVVSTENSGCLDFSGETTVNLLLLLGSRNCFAKQGRSIHVLQKCGRVRILLETEK